MVGECVWRERRGDVVRVVVRVVMVVREVVVGCVCGERVGGDGDMIWR